MVHQWWNRYKKFIGYVLTSKKYPVSGRTMNIINASGWIVLHGHSLNQGNPDK